MPGATPSLGFPYPYETEPINPADFANLANAIDVAMTDNATLAQTQLTGRPILRVKLLGGQTSASGFGATLNFDTLPQFITDPAGMYNTATPTFVTVRQTGVYLITAHDWTPQFGYTTVDYNEVLIFVNGVFLTGERGSGVFGTDANTIESCTTMWPLNVGDQVSVGVLWQGTGGPATWFSEAFLSMSYVCPLT